MRQWLSYKGKLKENLTKTELNRYIKYRIYNEKFKMYCKYSDRSFGKQYKKNMHILVKNEDLDRIGFIAKKWWRIKMNTYGVDIHKMPWK